MNQRRYVVKQISEKPLEYYAILKSNEKPKESARVQDLKAIMDKLLKIKDHKRKFKVQFFGKWEYISRIRG